MTLVLLSNPFTTINEYPFMDVKSKQVGAFKPERCFLIKIWFPTNMSISDEIGSVPVSFF